MMIATRLTDDAKLPPFTNEIYYPTDLFDGKPLSQAQAVTLRIALKSFAASKENDLALGTDEHGRAMTKLYRERTSELLDLFLPPPIF